MKVREVLDLMSKEDLIDLIIQYGEKDLLLIELFTLRAEYDFSYGDLEKIWYEIHRKTSVMDSNEYANVAELLAMGAELLFEQIKRIDSEEVKELLQSMIDDLEKAAEEEGIGMNEDSEWMYLQVKDDIEEYCGESK